MLLRKTVQTALAVLIAGFIGGMAHAHPVLETAVPGQGATVSSPKEIRLTFTEDLIAKFSGLTVKDQTGHLVETAGPSVDPMPSDAGSGAGWLPPRSPYLSDHLVW